MISPTFRREHIDNILNNQSFFGKVLDIGGKKINKRGKFVPPIENVVSWDYLNIEKSTNPDYHCDATNIPLDDNIFDIVVLTEVLEHIAEPVKVLSQANRVLKSKGLIYITMPFLYGIHGDPNDYQRWTPSKFRHELEKLGFKIHIIKPMGGLFSVLYDLAKMSIGMASKNRKAFKIKLIHFIILPVVAPLFRFLDKHFKYKEKFITTGFFIKAEKI